MRYLTVPMLALALFFPLAARAQQPADAASLLALHRAYVGWQFGDGTFNTLRLSGTWTNPNSSAHAPHPWTELEMGAIYRNTEIDPKTGEPSDDGFTGRVFWDSDENGFTRPNYSPRQALDISEYVLFNEGTTELTGTLEPSATISGTSYPAVRVQPPNGDALDLYVDPRTGAYVRAVVDPGGPYERTYDALAYTVILPGKRLISTCRVGDWLYTVTKTEPNVPITAEELHPPPQRATWVFANPNPFHIDVKPHAIFINASINGVSGRFILDTGASSIYVSNSFADRAHLSTITTSQAAGIGPNVIHTRIRRADALTVGGNTLSNVLITTGPLDFTEDNEHPDGLIGFPLLAGAIVSLSTSNQTMTISDPQTTTADTSGGAVIRVDLRAGVPVVPMLIDNRVKVNALLDMGDGSFVAMSPELVSKRNIPMMAHQYTGNVFSHPSEPNQVGSYINSHIVVMGVGGPEVEACSMVDSIALGPIVYQGTYYCESPSLNGDNIIVGYDFLKNFDFVFDYREGLIVLKPHAH